MKKFVAWARRSPLQYSGLVVLLIIGAEFFCSAAFNWKFSWSTILGNSVSVVLIGFAVSSWEKYEKKNGITKTLYKDRKRKGEVHTEPATQELL